MDEKEIIFAAGEAFLKSVFADRVNAVTGVNSNKTPYFAGFLQGVRFYANYLYQKHFIRMIRSILDTKTSKVSRPLETEEIVILHTLKNYNKLQQECIEKTKTIERLNHELFQTRERAKVNEARLNKQIEDLNYWLTNK